ncbi:tautomerase family protein [Metasolibacillus sp. FSL H7-0170]|uniref:tautomerase family protein n=1 Tax=Metasolibacillus TaxID=2703677 RepID=UPI0007944CFE|nr:tautomerase family protein [Metasolibacillus fluoroglycofenilyticus]KYG90863.1 hypothetical protein A0U40_17485 [[Bacillus] sp. KCTC 13219]
MPYITIKLMEGRSIEKKQQMVKEVTDALVNSLDITADDVRIELEELQYGMFARAGQLIIEKK